MIKIVLGIDPGSRITGYGIVAVTNREIQYLDSGCIRTQTDNMFDRLQIIFEGVKTLVDQYRPAVAAIEEVFLQHNAQSALKLGQARGAAISAIKTTGIDVYGYSPRQVKKAIVGYGAADKTQVQQMIKTLLTLNKVPQADAADALAIALCHIQTHAHVARIAAAQP